MRRVSLGVAGFALVTWWMVGNAGAVTLNGQGWNVGNGSPGASNAVISSIPGSGSTPADVTFLSNGISYSSFGNTTCFPPTNSCSGNPSLDYTVDSWLKSIPGVASGITYLNPVTEPGRSLSNGSTTGMIFRFTGQANFTTGQSFTVNHDDGITILVGGNFDGNGNLTGAGVHNLDTEIGGTLSPGPASPTTTSFTYPAGDPVGNQNVEIIFGECCSAPAVLNTTLANIARVPEPGSQGLLGSALVGLSALVLRLRRKVE